MAGAIWPYRFITHSLKSLLDTYPSFSLDTHTAALNVSSVTDTSSPSNYEVATTRGSIKTKHVVYATSAWTPHFVTGLHGAMSGGRLPMSTQLDGSGHPKAGGWPSYTGNGSLPSGRAWSLYRNGLDYVVQMPLNGEYMFGGGPGDGGGDDDNTGNTTALSDSGPPSHVTASYLNGALSSYFGYENWGAERTDFPQETAAPDVHAGRTKRVWVGIEGSSRDSRPFLGLRPHSTTARPVKNASAGGEWVSAAFDGEGMCFAWLCGRALSQMIASGGSGGQEVAAVPEWFPRSFLVTGQRLANRTVARREARHWMHPRKATAFSWDD